jgi:beta-glucuronidase
VVSLNRYYGWYVNGGSLDQGMANLAGEIEAIHAEYAKPVIMTEFGADCVAGSHAQPPEMFSEEYQADVIMRSLAVFRSKPYIVGYHVWNLCDFKTGQGVIRVSGMNLKGVFTRDRRPKLAAHRIREAWTA